MTNPGGRSFSKVVQVPQDAAADTTQSLSDHLNAAPNRNVELSLKTNTLPAVRDCC